MISYLSLENFKLFQKKTEFEFSNLNLLTGINGRGKSTLLQAILLFKQSFGNNTNSSHLLLNDKDCVELGEFEDVKNKKESLSKPIKMAFSLKQKNWNSLINFEFDFIYLDFQKSVLGVDSCNINSKHPIRITKSLTKTISLKTIDHKEDMILLKEYEEGVPRYFSTMFSFIQGISEHGENNNFVRLRILREIAQIHYISADRIGPKVFYEKSKIPAFLSVDKKGNNVADILSSAISSNQQVHSSLHIKENEYSGVKIQDISATILAQVGNWIGFITDTNNLAIELDSTHPYVSIIRFNIEGTSYSPMNIGFGYSYILPIIISGLIARAGQILIVENPEAHLHPRAQSRLANFLSKVANTGVQIFIESHSEHILNAIRVSIKKKELSPEDAKVFYFMDNEIVTPIIDADGRIDQWEDGFFDEWDINLMELM